MIDDEGNLFGVLNVIDALVVLLVLAVAVAGLALVFVDDSGESAPPVETTYATLDMGTQPNYIASAISEGDTYRPDGSSTLTVSDVHVSPRSDGVGVTLRVQLEGPVAEDTIQYANAPPRLGRPLSLETARYTADGRIRAVGDDSALAREHTTVLLRDTLDVETADAVDPGDELRVGGRTAATIETIRTYATSNPDRTRAFVTATVAAYRQDGRLRFGGNILQRGQPLSLPAEQYTISGTIERVGDDVGMAQTTTRTVTLRMNDLRQDTASAIRPGQTEGSSTDPVAEITAVDTEPSIIIATGDDGSVNVVDHPINRDVTITASLRVSERPSGIQFKGEPLRSGSTVTLDLGTALVEAEVVRIGR